MAKNVFTALRQQGMGQALREQLRVMEDDLAAISRAAHAAGTSPGKGSLAAICTQQWQQQMHIIC